ncbi:uncharacterized protein [Halyomorpha halys]|uniref:uncharacterized protein n=1 Tax=Halyomorpha halys TaxID=286706 RepID=UPI0006D4FDEC
MENTKGGTSNGPQGYNSIVALLQNFMKEQKKEREEFWKKQQQRDEERRKEEQQWYEEREERRKEEQQMYEEQRKEEQQMYEEQRKEEQQMYEEQRKERQQRYEEEKKEGEERRKEEQQMYEEQRKERQQRYEEEKKEREERRKEEQQLYEERRKEREEYWKRREQRDENSSKAIEDFKKKCFVKIDATISSLDRTVNKLNTNRFDDDKRPNQATSAEEETRNNSEDLKTGNQDATSAVYKEDSNTKELEDQEIEELETEKEPLEAENSRTKIPGTSPSNVIEREIISDEQEILDSTLIDEHEILKEETESCKKNEGIDKPLKICQEDINEEILESKGTLVTCPIEAEEEIKQIEKKKYEVTTGEAKGLNLRGLIKLVTSEMPLRLVGIKVGLNENYSVVGYKVFLKKFKGNFCRDELSLLEGLDSKSPLNRNSINKGRNLKYCRDLPTKSIRSQILSYGFYEGYMVLDHVRKGLILLYGVDRQSLS